MESVRIGSELWLDGSENVETIDEMMRKMAENGLLLARVFVMWHHIEPAEGLLDFTLYDAVFNAAERNGVAVVPTLTAVYPPQWAVAPDIAIGWEDCHWQLVRRHVHDVVGRYANSPVLDSWILWNEPTLILEKNSRNSVDYLRFLQEKGLDAEYKVLSQLVDTEGDAPFKDAINEDSWCEFTVRSMMNAIGRLAAAVREIDPAHEVHVNPHSVALMAMYMGQDCGRRRLRWILSAVRLTRSGMPRALCETGFIRL